jgi:hypothetical protein
MVCAVICPWPEAVAVLTWPLTLCPAANIHPLPSRGSTRGRYPKIAGHVRASPPTSEYTPCSGQGQGPERGIRRHTTTQQQKLVEIEGEIEGETEEKTAHKGLLMLAAASSQPSFSVSGKRVSCYVVDGHEGGTL